MSTGRKDSGEQYLEKQASAFLLLLLLNAVVVNKGIHAKQRPARV
jgi:hypothetical protein